MERRQVPVSGRTGGGVRNCRQDGWYMTTYSDLVRESEPEWQVSEPDLVGVGMDRILHRLDGHSDEGRSECALQARCGASSTALNVVAEGAGIRVCEECFVELFEVSESEPEVSDGKVHLLGERTGSGLLCPCGFQVSVDLFAKAPESVTAYQAFVTCGPCKSVLVPRNV